MRRLTKSLALSVTLVGLSGVFLHTESVKSAGWSARSPMPQPFGERPQSSLRRLLSNGDAAAQSATNARNRVTKASVTTDKFSYEPGEIVTITGTGWQPLETVSLVLTAFPPRLSHGDLAYYAVADQQGTILNNHFAMDAGGVDDKVTYYLTATGSLSSLTAQAVFRDPQAASLAPPCVTTSSITSNFNGTSISPSNYVWFNANFNASGIQDGTTISFTNSTIKVVSSDGTPYTVAVPNATITFSSSVSASSTTFSGGQWVTTVPRAGSDEIWLSCLLIKASDITGSPSVDLKASSVTWTGDFNSSTSGVNVNWKWGAAVYKADSTVVAAAADPNEIGVKATHTYSTYTGSDHAGTPMNLKKSVIGGARGGGGSNYTGSWSGTQRVVPCVSLTGTLTLVKTATETTFSGVGDTIHYSYLLTNNTNETLSAPFEVIDDKAMVSCPPTPTTLAPGATITCTASYTVTEEDVAVGKVTNTAFATAKDPQGLPVTSNTATQTVTKKPNEELPILSMLSGQGSSTTTSSISGPLSTGSNVCTTNPGVGGLRTMTLTYEGRNGPDAGGTVIGNPRGLDAAYIVVTGGSPTSRIFTGVASFNSKTDPTSAYFVISAGTTGTLPGQVTVTIYAAGAVPTCQR